MSVEVTLNVEMTVRLEHDGVEDDARLLAYVTEHRKHACFLWDLRTAMLATPLDTTEVGQLDDNTSFGVTHVLGLTVSAVEDVREGDY